MISTEQWHAAIDCFVPSTGKFNTSKCIGKVLNRGSTCSHYSIKRFILIMTVLSALLIMAGDVELNPGPRGFRKCPQCEQQVPIKCKTCTNCGLSFTSRSPDVKHVPSYVYSTRNGGAPGLHLGWG